MEEVMRQGLADAIDALKKGRIVLLHDSSSRENEVDMVASAITITPSQIAFMRQHAGGLICSALGNEIASAIGLPYMHDLLREASSLHPVLGRIAQLDTPYGGRPAFSVTLNHREAFTGISDSERSMTVKAIGEVAGAASVADAAAMFANTLRSPGHVPLLIESHGGLRTRKGHTELSIALMRFAGLPPASVVCEMLDAESHRSLTVDRASVFAREHRLQLIEGSEILRMAGI